MKYPISKDTIKPLLLMLDDFWRMDNDDEPEFDYLAIMRNLVIADKNRDENLNMELSSETVRFLLYMADSMCSAYQTPKAKMSREATEALNAELAKPPKW